MAIDVPSKLLIKDLYYPFDLILNMELFLTIIVIAVAILGMSLGILLNNKPLQGSCGGVATDCVCLNGGTCDDPSQKPVK